MVLDHPHIQLAPYCALHVERQFETATIWLTGEFDLACEDRFREVLDSALDGRVATLLLDLRGLEFIDSTGLQILVRIDAAARSDGFELVVLCGDGHVRRVLRESGLDGLLPVVDPSGTVPPTDSPV